jgi:hypothetical protein
LPTTAYHPQSNGLVERFHRRLKDALRSRATTADWHDHLPWVMLGVSFREDSEFSPAEAVFGSQLILPGQFINTAESSSPSFLNDLQTTMTGHPPPPTRHNSAPAPSILPEELLLASYWATGTGRSRRCRQSTTDLTDAGAVNTFLSPRDGQENRQDVHTPPQSSPDLIRVTWRGVSSPPVGGLQIHLDGVVVCPSPLFVCSRYLYRLSTQIKRKVVSIIFQFQFRFSMLCTVSPVWFFMF